MKYLLICSVFNFWQIRSFARTNAVDNLKTQEDVTSFFSTRYNPKTSFSGFSEESAFFKSFSDSIIKRYSIKSWDKGDLNNDGFTDIVANFLPYSFETYAAISHGDSFQIIKLYKKIPNPAFNLSKIIQVKNQFLLLVTKYPYNGFKRKFEFKTDTLKYIFNDFIEYNGNVQSRRKMKFFEFNEEWENKFITSFKINEKGKCHSFFYSKDHKQLDLYTAQMDAKQLAEFNYFLNYIKINDLNNHFEYAATHLNSAKITVKIGSGRKKKIIDYGMSGTYGLSRLYDYFYFFRNNLKWDKVATM